MGSLYEGSNEAARHERAITSLSVLYRYLAGESSCSVCARACTARAEGQGSHVSISAYRFQRARNVAREG